MEAEEAQLWARWIVNDDEVSIFLDIVSLTVTMYCLCLVAVSFDIVFIDFLFFPISYGLNQANSLENFNPNPSTAQECSPPNINKPHP